MSQKYPQRQRPVYGNIEVLHPEGFLMFCASDKKAHWYLSRGLATIVQKDPPIIKLTFTPKGSGRKLEQRSLVFKKNICVCCGHTIVDQMNRHHIVPYCFRKSFPEIVKDNNDYDVVCICFDCHEKYETTATDLKRDLAEKYHVLFHQETSKMSAEQQTRHRAQKSAIALLNHRSKIPAARINELEGIILEYLKKSQITTEDLRLLTNTVEGPPKPSRELLYGHLIAQKVLQEPDGLNQFFRLWRKHFLEIMSPKFMPSGWHENLPIRYP